MISFSFSTKASFSFFSESVWEERKRNYEGWKREGERGGNIFRCTARIKKSFFHFSVAFSLFGSVVLLFIWSHYLQSKPTEIVFDIEYLKATKQKKLWMPHPSLLTKCVVCIYVCVRFGLFNGQDPINPALSSLDWLHQFLSWPEDCFTAHDIVFINQTSPWHPFEEISGHSSVWVNRHVTSWKIFRDNQFYTHFYNK